jgi:hypothetical protein
MASIAINRCFLCASIPSYVLTSLMTAAFDAALARCGANPRIGGSDHRVECSPHYNVRMESRSYLENPRFQRRSQHRRRLTIVPGLQAREAMGQKPAPPAIDEVAVTRYRGLDHRVRGPIGEHQDHTRPAARLPRESCGCADGLRALCVHHD